LMRSFQNIFLHNFFHCYVIVMDFISFFCTSFKAWLNAVYLQVENAAFENQHPSELSTLSGLAQVLTFADAVDSSKGLICALVTQLQRQSVTATVQLGELQVNISTSLCHIWDQGSTEWGLYSYSPLSANTVKQGAIMTSDQKAQITRLLAQQAEAALHIGYKLRLPYVQTVLHKLIRNNSCWFNSLLYGALNHIFSERVLYVAAGATRTHKELLAASTTTQAFTLTTAIGCQQLLRPVGLDPSAMQPIRFTAELLQDCFGCSRGERVPVELDLFHASRLRVGKDPVGVTVQLLGGPTDL